MNQAGTFVYLGETPGGCHLSNRGYLLMKRAKRVKWQAPPVAQCVHIVAGGDPNTITIKGVAFSDIVTYVLTRGDACSLAPLDCSITTGYSEARPLGESGPTSKSQDGLIPIINQ